MIVHTVASLHAAPSALESLVLTPAETRTVALREGTRRFLHEAAAWRWFVTLTFARDVRDGAASLAFGRWRQRIACDAYLAHVRIGWVHAPQRRGVQHLHGLVAPVEPHEAPVEPADIRRLWMRGSVDVQPVHSAIGAIDYMLEHTDLTADDIRSGWDLDVVCTRRPRCRRAGIGCRYRPGPAGAT